MVPTLLVLALGAAGAMPAAAPVDSLDAVVARLREGATPAAVARALEESGAWLPMTPEQAVRLYFDGVPAEVLAAVAATSGAPHPRISGRPGELELAYDGYRIVGRRSPSGPVLVVSGFARDGSRLRPPVEPEPEPVAADRAAAASRRPVPEPAVGIDDLPPPDRLGRAVPPAPAGWSEPAVAMPPWPVPDRRGAPEQVTITQVPAGSLRSATVVLPLGGSVSYAGPGYASYGSYVGSYGGYGSYVGSGYGGYGGYGVYAGQVQPGYGLAHGHHPSPGGSWWPYVGAVPGAPCPGGVAGGYVSYRIGAGAQPAPGRRHPRVARDRIRP